MDEFNLVLVLSPGARARRKKKERSQGTNDPFPSARQHVQDKVSFIWLAGYRVSSLAASERNFPKVPEKETAINPSILDLPLRVEKKRDQEIQD